MTARKPQPQPPPNADDPEQSRRFIDMAQEIETAEDQTTFDRVFKKVSDLPKGAPESPDKAPSSSTRK